MTRPLVALSLAALLAAVGSAPAAPRPLYYDHPMESGDLNDRSSEELRLMRNTIYARAGREFKDPDLRDYFARQPWYRPTATPAKLSPVDEKNLARIHLWEPLAKAREALRRLVPGWGKSVELPPGTDCEANKKGVLSNRKLARRLAALQRQLTWADADFCNGEPWPEAITNKAEVRLSCWPDLDGDGAPESVVSIRAEFREPYGESVTRTRTFLVSGKGPSWRAVAPLGVDGMCPGVEGSHSTAVTVVKLASGELALAVETESGGGGDCDEEFNTVSLLTWKEGKLILVGTFQIDGPTCVD